MGSLQVVQLFDCMLPHTFPLRDQTSFKLRKRYVPFKNTAGLKFRTSSNGINFLSTTEYFQKNPKRIGTKSKYTVGIKV